MDIAKFNEILGSKVAKARIYEKHNELNPAIKLWIEISEMTLKFSKTSGLDSSYRNMLIRRTEKIIEHIKDLKLGPKEQEIIVEEIIPEKITLLEQEFSELVEEEPSIKQEIESNKSSITDAKKVDSSNSKNIKLIENSDVKKFSDGIKEIEAPKDFKIITPHDPNYVKKMMELTRNKNNFKNQKKTNHKDNDSGNKVICFACGEELPRNTKICSNCGVKLT
ncbi:MAG: hypothetical protein ACFFAN_04340 [Promethearchaeota archaeon]